MKLTLVVAIDQNRLIGANGRLPWNLPEDLKRFKAITWGHPMIMGRKTYESIGRPLPGRTSLVVTRQKNLDFPGAEVFGSLGEAIRRAKELDPNEAFVIGGSEIFREALELADRVHLTVIEKSFQGDVYLPEFPQGKYKKVSEERIDGTLPHRNEVWESHSHGLGDT